MVILKPNTLENYYSGSTRIYSLWCQRQNFLLCSFLLYIFPFENAHSQRWMSSRNILKEYKVQRPCKLSQGQTLKFRHVELVEKKILVISLQVQGRKVILFPTADCPHQSNIGSAGLELPFKMHLFDHCECRQVTRTPSWLAQQDWIWSSKQLTHMGENLSLFLQIEILVFHPTLVLNSLSVP